VSRGYSILIGNSVNYISQQRREAILSTFPTSRSNLAKILRQICNKDFEVGEKETELFGSKAMENVSERVNALEAFKKLLLRLTHPRKKGVVFGERPGCKVQEQCGPIKLAPILTRRGLQRSEAGIPTKLWGSKHYVQGTLQTQTRTMEKMNPTLP